jgi:[ribosomal protein S5]-alanine N-acetyltransferase
LTLQTARLTLRPLRGEDLDAMAALLGDGEALAQWGRPLDREGARDWIGRNIRRYEIDGFGRCAVELRDTGELIGDCGLITTTVEGVREVELGWIVRRVDWGRGFATEAAGAWMEYALRTLALPRVVSMIGERNGASRRVAEKLGMSLERRAVWGDTEMLMYALTQPSDPR